MSEREADAGTALHEEGPAESGPVSVQEHDAHDVGEHDPTPAGFATPVSAAPPAPAQAVLSADQFRKIDNLQRSLGRLSRRFTLLVLLNFIMLGLLGWGWYKDHQPMVDQYINKLMPASNDAPVRPGVRPQQAPANATPVAPTPAPAVEVAPPAPAAASAQDIGGGDSAAAQKLFDDAKTLEAAGNYPDALAKLDEIKTKYTNGNWPPGFTDALARVQAKANENSTPGFFGVH